MTSAVARTALDIADWRRRVFALYDAVREADDPEFFFNFSPNGYALGLNAVLYSMSH